MRLKRLFLVAALLVLPACAARMPRVPPNPLNPVYTVAVLPMYNATNDVGGAESVREEFTRRIENRHYSVMPLKEVDTILMDRMGVTLGSQLELTSPSVLGDTLGVDGVVYGYLINFDDITTGVYNVKKVRAGFKLVDTKTGNVVWSQGHGVKSVIAGGDIGAAVTILKELRDSDADIFKTIQGLEEIPGLRDWQVIRAGGTEKVGEAAAIAIGEKLITKALGVHLRLETDVMLKFIMRGFPAGPGAPREHIMAPRENNGGR